MTLLLGIAAFVVIVSMGWTARGWMEGRDYFVSYYDAAAGGGGGGAAARGGGAAGDAGAERPGGTGDAGDAAAGAGVRGAAVLDSDDCWCPDCSALFPDDGEEVT